MCVQNLIMEYFYNQRKNYGYYDQPTHPTGQVMATAALASGIIAVFSLWTLYLPLVFGGLGLIFAFLSKGFEKKFINNAKIGLIFSASGFFISLLVILFSLVYLFNNPDALLNVGRQLDQMFLQTYGENSQSVFENSYEDMLRQFVR